MALEETTRDPLVDRDSDHLDQVWNTDLKIFRLLSLINSLEEEVLEGLERVLVHVINDAELNEQEVKHSSFCGNRSVGLS